MKKLLRLFLLVPTLLFADTNDGYVYISQVDEHGEGEPSHVFYLQATTINYSLPNAKVRYWVKMNSNKNGESFREYVEGDCRNLTTRGLRLDTFKKLDLKGEVDFSDTSPKTEVKYVVPDSIEDALLQTVCGYREKKLRENAIQE